MIDPIAEIKKYTGVVLQERRCIGCTETDLAVCAPCYTERYGSPSLSQYSLLWRDDVDQLREPAPEVIAQGDDLVSVEPADPARVPSDQR